MRHALPIVLVAALAGATSAHATTVPAMDVDVLATFASHIVTGNVRHIESRWEGKVITTDVLIEVERCYKGDCEARDLTVRVLGGAAEGYVMHVDGMASFSLGEQVLLFLDPVGASAPGKVRTVGLAQGKFRIEQSHGGERRLLRDMEGLSLLGDATRVKSLDTIDLAAMESRIEAALDR